MRVVPGEEFGFQTSDDVGHAGEWTAIDFRINGCDARRVFLPQEPDLASCSVVAAFGRTAAVVAAISQNEEISLRMSCGVFPLRVDLNGDATAMKWFFEALNERERESETGGPAL